MEENCQVSRPRLQQVHTLKWAAFSINLMQDTKKEELVRFFFEKEKIKISIILMRWLSPFRWTSSHLHAFYCLPILLGFYCISEQQFSVIQTVEGSDSVLKWYTCTWFNPLWVIYLLLLRVEVVVLSSNDLWVEGVWRDEELSAGFLCERLAGWTHRE